MWTGTTYALAAAMLHEARHQESSPRASPGSSPPPTASHHSHPGDELHQHSLLRLASFTDKELAEPLLLSPHATATATSSSCPVDRNRPLTAAERRELAQMSHLTARGIHDAGWQRFGYWFATPEGWEQSGGY